MFTLTSIDNKLVLTQKRCGLVVEKSCIAGIHINDEVIEINHIKVLCNRCMAVTPVNFFIFGIYLLSKRKMEINNLV